MQGLKYPLTVDPGSGTLALAEDNQLTSENILSVLQTEQGERVMRPDYGIRNLLFESIQEDTAIETFTENQLRTYVSSVRDAQFDVETRIDDRSGSLEVFVNWEAGELNVTNVVIE